MGGVAHSREQRMEGNCCSVVQYSSIERGRRASNSTTRYGRVDDSCDTMTAMRCGRDRDVIEGVRERTWPATEQTPADAARGTCELFPRQQRTRCS